jgi:serine/threonine-protein kinase
MTPEDARLFSVAHAIAERLPIDWVEADATALDPASRDTLHELQVIAEIAGLHRASARTRDSDSWGAFELVEHIGHGSYGDVYRAIDTRLDREVALKLLRRPELGADRRGSAVIEEARLLARVRHANVVTIHGADRIDGRVGLWMEFVRGRTLANIVQQGGSLPADAVASIGADVCSALDAVHQAGLLHRDIKAQNVMQEDTGRVVLMDFGAGRDAAEHGGCDLAGTPLYLAPELLRGQPATVQSDLYSLGVLLFHLATGTYPVPGRTLAEIRAAHTVERRLSVRTLAPGLPPDLASAIDRALAPAASERHANAAAMAAEIGRTVASPEQAVRDRRGRLTLLGALVLAALIGLTWYSSGAASAPSGDRAVWKGLDVDLFGTVSDDGRFLTFIDWNTTDNLMLRDLRAGTSRPLTPNRNRGEFGIADYSVMSQDGSRVVYSWWPAGAGTDELHLMTLVDGGPGPDRILWRGTEDEGLQAYEWSPDETWLLVRRIRRLARERDIATLNVVTGELRVLETFPTYLRAGDMSVSPDGRYIAYDLGEVGGPQHIHVLRVADGHDTRVVVGTGRNTPMGWSRSGYLLVASDRGGKLDLWALPMENGVSIGAPVHVKQDIGSSWSLGLTSSDTLYVWRRSGARSFRVAPFDASRGVIDESASPYAEYFIDSRGRHDWSADARFVAFVDCGQNGGGGCSITMRDNHTSQTWKVPHRMGYVWYPRLSPDGRFIVTHGSQPGGDPHIFLIDARTGETSIVTGNISRQQYSLEWSADGRRIYLFRDADGERPARLVERDLASGSERVVFGTSLPEVREIRISPDGRLVAFRARTAEGWAVMVAPLAEGEARPIMSVAAPALIDWRVEWTHDSRGLLIKKAPVPNVVDELWLAPVDGSPRHLNIDTSRWDGDGSVQMDPTGRYLSYVASAGDVGAEVWALENFLPRPDAAR